MSDVNLIHKMRQDFPKQFGQASDEEVAKFLYSQVQPQDIDLKEFTSSILLNDPSEQLPVTDMRPGALEQVKKAITSSGTYEAFGQGAGLGMTDALNTTTVFADELSKDGGFFASLGRGLAEGRDLSEVAKKRVQDAAIEANAMQQLINRRRDKFAYEQPAADATARILGTAATVIATGGLAAETPLGGAVVQGGNKMLGTAVNVGAKQIPRVLRTASSRIPPVAKKYAAETVGVGGLISVLKAMGVL